MRLQFEYHNPWSTTSPYYLQSTPSTSTLVVTPCDTASTNHNKAPCTPVVPYSPLVLSNPMCSNPRKRSLDCDIHTSTPVTKRLRSDIHGDLFFDNDTVFTPTNGCFQIRRRQTRQHKGLFRRVVNRARSAVASVKAHFKHL
ncbi:uncharacterized protein LOC144435766 [Glandiceps talaboti]